MAEPIPLPHDEIPKCWEDDTRMNALFAPFRMKSVNPESWDMKMKFWTDVLRKWCSHRRVPIITVKEFKDAFRRKGRTPACLDIVVEENARLGELSPTSKYTTAFNNDKEGWMRWGVRQAFKPAGLAVSALTTFLPFSREPPDGIPTSKIDVNERFVCEDVLLELANELQDTLPPDSRVGTMSDLMEASGHENKETFLLIIGYLIHHGRAVKKGDLIKIGNARSKVTPITEHEESLVRLIQAERRLLSETEKLNSDIAKAQMDAKNALKLGNKSLAKGHLKRKHVLMAKSDRTESALDNVRHLLFSVRQASTNSDILDTYKVSVDAMKQQMKKSNIDEDSVADTMDELKEVLDIQNEIEKSLAGTLDDADTIDLEEELAELLAEEQTNKQGDRPTDKRTDKDKASSGQSKDTSDFIFDGEARVLAELNELGLDDLGSPSASTSTPIAKKAAVAISDDAKASTPKKEVTSQHWYPKSGDALKSNDDGWNINKASTVRIPNTTDFGELRLDNRLHPGQSLDTRMSPGVMYKEDFLIQDHRLNDGLWVYNPNEPSASSPTSSQQRSLAPGSERRNPSATATHWQQEDGLDDIERRLKNLRQL